jgi:hypothetical protein
MNTRLLIGAAMLAVAIVPAVAYAQSQPTAVPYTYGMKLDVAKVISMTEPNPNRCKVITAQMTYQDSAGQLKAISYKKLDEICSTQD